jgi:2-haloacid dehalogenase
MPDLPKAVVFDIGNVLINWDPDQLYSQLVPDPEERRRLFEECDLSEMNLDVDRGKPFRETVYATADRYPEYAPLIRAWADRWIEMASPDIPGTAILLRRLRVKGVPVFSLSNFGIETYAHAKTVYSVLTEFDQDFISGHLGCIKPDPEIYEALEKGTGYSGSDLIFADDRTDNIEQAKERGWHGHVFTTPELFAAELVAQGLLTEEEARLS